MLTLYNTSLGGLATEFFEKLGNVYNISIEIDTSNKKFNTMPNPNSALYPNMPDNVLLTKLDFNYASLTCDCGVGWVEFWQRKKRQYLCAHQEWEDDTPTKSQMYDDDDDDDDSNCDDPFEDDSLRTARCSNKNGENLLEILKSELECGWSSATQKHLNIYIAIAFTVCLLGFLF